MNNSLANVLTAIIGVTNKSASNSSGTTNSEYNSSLSNPSTLFDNSTFSSLSVYPTNDEIDGNNEYICIEKYDYYESTEKWLLGKIFINFFITITLEFCYSFKKLNGLK